jgi:ABC-type cobalamin transport system permease subunit
MTELGYTNWIRFLVWLVIGLDIYISYSYEHSLLGEKISPWHKVSKQISIAGAFIAALIVVFFYPQHNLVTELLYAGLALAIGFLITYIIAASYFSIFKKSRPI